MPDETPPGDESTYTPPASQEDLNRIVEQRLARERGKYADYDDLKAKAAKFDEADAASKTELQKLQDAVAERDKTITDLPRTVRAQAIRFASEATKAGFLDPEDALVFIDADLSDADAVRTALEELAERKPHLVRQEKTPKKLPKRPTAKKGDTGEDGDEVDDLKGKERAAAALRQFSSTR
jgi:hypothetical protein